MSRAIVDQQHFVRGLRVIRAKVLRRRDYRHCALMMIWSSTMSFVIFNQSLLLHLMLVLYIVVWESGKWNYSAHSSNKAVAKRCSENWLFLDKRALVLNQFDSFPTALSNESKHNSKLKRHEFGTYSFGRNSSLCT
jgi:hypothetical protein